MYYFTLNEIFYDLSNQVEYSKVGTIIFTTLLHKSHVCYYYPDLVLQLIRIMMMQGVNIR